MKKIIAVLTVISIVFAFSACSSKKYKDTEATVPVTNAQGETVTDNNGDLVTENVTSESDKATVNASSESSTSSKNGSTKAETVKNESKSTTKASTSNKETTKKKPSSNAKTTKASQSSKIEPATSNTSISASKNQNNAQGVTSSSAASKTTTKKADSTTKKADSTTKKAESTTKKSDSSTTTETKPTTTKPTTTEKPKKRDIKVKVVLPYYNDEQSRVKVGYKLEGDKDYTFVSFADPDDSKKEIDYKTVNLDGKTTVDCTIENVKGDVKIAVWLHDFSGKDNIKNNTATVKSNETQVTITPLTGIGMINGEDESLD